MIFCAMSGALVTRMPDIRTSRPGFGSAAGDDTAPYPQLRDRH